MEVGVAYRESKKQIKPLKQNLVTSEKKNTELGLMCNKMKEKLSDLEVKLDITEIKL